MKEKFDVTGMSCSACSSHVEKSVSKLEGIKTVSVNLLTNSMQVEYDETKLDTGKIIEAVEHAGYGASVKEDGKAAVKAVGIRNTRYAVPCGLIADLAGIIAAVVIAYLFFA